jgi:hypothetical protein
MQDLKSRAAAFLALSDEESRGEGFNELPMQLECDADSEPTGEGTGDFVLGVIRRYLHGELRDDPDVRNNLAFFSAWLTEELRLERFHPLEEPYYRECLAILDGIWDEVYGGS